ncbi:MAG: hypothetical protein AAGI23_21135 [Bacteroidota bacterium]
MNRLFNLSLVLMLIILSSCSTYELIDYENSYSNSYELESKLMEDSSNIFRFEPAAWAYSFIGQEDKATIMWDSSRVALKRNYNFEDVDTFDAAKIVSDHPFISSAKKAILERASSHQLTMINEAHHDSHHRLFTQSLLEVMYLSGYRHLGLEAIEINDALPYIDEPEKVSKQSGLYIQDPEFSEMIKYAIQLGYSIFEYEASDTIYGAEREKVQAANIIAYAAKFSNDKLLIHCGFGHLIESETNKYTSYPLMGRQIQLIGKINPLTIDQTRYNAGSHFSFEKNCTDWLLLNNPWLFKVKTEKSLVQMVSISMYFIHRWIAKMRLSIRCKFA